ncbi:MAG: zinc-dependent alcohol dehydrogenase family protein [Nannocystales bacterium]
MRAVVVREAFGLDNLHLVEQPKPEPGPGQVRVRVHAVSLNYRDLLMVQGQYNPRQPLPLVPASDGVGVIDAVGPGVDPSRVGDRVAGLFAQGWLDGEPAHDSARSTLGGPLPGMLREWAILEPDGVASVPSHLTDVQAATLPCAGLTAWSALVTLGGIRAGDTVLVQGSGGVSSFALDFAVAAGARVIATSRSADKADALAERGAWKTVVTTGDSKWGKTVRGLTDGRGVDLVVEVGGAGTLGQSLRAVRMGGTVAMIGVLAGGRAEVDMTPVLMGQVRVQGVLVGHRAGFRAMCRNIEHHRLEPRIDSVYPLEETRAAFDHLASGTQRGKICIELTTAGSPA